VSSSWLAETFLPLLAVALAFNFGVRRLGHTQAPARTLKVTVVQPSIPQTFIWDPNKSAERFRDLLSLCERALSNRTDLLVWPESAIPELLRYDKETAVAVSEMARRHQVWMIVGADDFEPRPNAARPEDGDFFNASFLINPEGKLVAPWYRKRSLVIFGEYVPCSRWLPFLKWFTPTQGGFTPGDQPVQFPMDGLSATASVLICFEDVFPQLARASVEPATDFLVNLTNDGWFGEGAEQWQHATSALFRAVENGRPLVRCANNGLTCWIDGQGRLGDVFHDPARSVYGQGFATFALPLPDPAHRPPPTFYNRHGDWFGWSCVAIAAPLLAWSALAARTRARAAR
jgi:apolipoprotein N-acyltransferase